MVHRCFLKINIISTKIQGDSNNVMIFLVLFVCFVIESFYLTVLIMILFVSQKPMVKYFEA